LSKGGQICARETIVVQGRTDLCKGDNNCAREDSCARENTVVRGRTELCKGGHTGSFHLIVSTRVSPSPVSKSGRYEV
jgi:hypothetical protein